MAGILFEDFNWSWLMQFQRERFSWWNNFSQEIFESYKKVMQKLKCELYVAGIPLIWVHAITRREMQATYWFKKPSEYW